MKKILMVTHFTQTPGEAGNARFAYLARLLSNRFEVEVITTSFSHRTKEQRNISSEQYEELPYKLTLVNEPGYKKNVSLRRFYSHWRFSLALKTHLENIEKPDLIYCSVPSLDAANVVAKYAETKNIPMIIDIQDLWPEAFKMVFNIPGVSDLLFKPMQRKADYIYNSAEAIIAVSKTYIDRAVLHSNMHKDTCVVYLGTDLKEFDRYKKLNTSEKNMERFVIGYAGTLGNSYDIKVVIDAISILQKKSYKNIDFLVMGDGPLRKIFEQYARDKNVSAQFTGRLEYSDMVQRLANCDITANPIVVGAAQSIINKHADYAAIGLPVVNTQQNQEYRELVESFKMGYNCEPGNATDLAEKIEILFNNKDLCMEMGVNARKCAKECFDRQTTYQEIETIIRKILGKM